MDQTQTLLQATGLSIFIYYYLHYLPRTCRVGCYGFKKNVNIGTIEKASDKIISKVTLIHYLPRPICNFSCPNWPNYLITPQSSDFSRTVSHSPFSLQALPEGILKSMPQKNSGEKFLGFSKSAEAGSRGYVTTEKWRNQISGVFQDNKNLFSKTIKTCFPRVLHLFKKGSPNKPCYSQVSHQPLN